MPLDGVYLSEHGAASATGDDDPDATVFALVRMIVGPDVPVIATLDLHGNVTKEMVGWTDALVAYRENPHVDMAERGEEAASIMRRMLGGMRTAKGFAKLPMIPPSVTQLTKSGPYTDLLAYGQSKIDADVVNVSILSGFSLTDSPKNGLSVIVTTTGDAQKAQTLAGDIARHAWSERRRWVPRLTLLEEATAMAVACGRDPARPPLLFADVADNPGGGGRGNTTYILEAFYRAEAQGVVLGIFNDPPLADEAHRLGVGAAFHAVFNRGETQEFSRRFEAPGKVLALSEGKCVGRRGMAAGRTVDLGRSALVEVGGIRVAVISIRNQCLDPMFLEMFGVDIAAARSVIVKSRGHFRAGFDEFFPDDRILEVDVPGLTTPVLSRFPFRRVPRPIFPLDPDMEWSP
jgi:microcystin degradation protein MlrC